MLKLSNGAVGAAVFGTVSGFLSGLCFGLRVWWPAGVFLFAALACLMWSGRVSLLIDAVLAKHGIPLEGIHDTEMILKKVEKATEVYPSNPAQEIPGSGVKPPRPWPRPRSKDRQVN